MEDAEGVAEASRSWSVDLFQPPSYLLTHEGGSEHGGDLAGFVQFCSCFEAGFQAPQASLQAPQASLQLPFLLPPPTECWGYRPETPQPATVCF